MIVSLMYLAMAAGSADAVLTDQTGDVAVLGLFLEATRAGKEDRAKKLLKHDAFIGDYGQQRRTSFADFAAYSRGCAISQIKAIPTRGNLPIGVEWMCDWPNVERKASFWFANGRISRIGWGKPPVISVTPPNGSR